MATKIMHPIASMSTTSMTTSSTIANSAAVPSSMSSSSSEKSNTTGGTPNDAVQKMQSNLVRYARAQDRRMVLRSLKDVKFLNSLILDPIIQPSADMDLKELEGEVCDEAVILNGVPFKPIGRNAIGMTRGSNCTLPMLKGVCAKLCDMVAAASGKSSDLTGDGLYEQLVLRLANTPASADPYFRLNSLLGSSDLMVMPLTNSNNSGELNKSLSTEKPRSKALQKLMAEKEAPQFAKPPIHLNVYEANGSLHCTMTHTHKFGLFRKNDVKSGRAWIAIDAVVGERTNMSTGKGVRTMCVKLPELY